MARRDSRNHTLSYSELAGSADLPAEALARVFIGRITLVDFDVVDESNLNRQIVALKSTIGKPKVQVMKQRIEDINPACCVEAKNVFVDADNADDFIGEASYAVDAVDNVTAKLAIITACRQKNIPCISAMGAGNKLDGSFIVTDISKTSGDSLARVIRRELRKRGIEHQKVVCSNDKAMIKIQKGEPIPSISYMPGLCGLTLAGEVVRDIVGDIDE